LIRSEKTLNRSDKKVAVSIKEQRMSEVPPGVVPVGGEGMGKGLAPVLSEPPDIARRPTKWTLRKTIFVLMLVAVVTVSCCILKQII